MQSPKMQSPQTPINKDIEQALQRALEGDTEAARTFFQELLQGPVYVPERFQMHPMTDAPEYPNEFLNILGIQVGENVVVPIFSDPTYISEWCGNELKFRQLSGKQLFSVIPVNWSLSVNPGNRSGKEITAWEVEQLRAGPEGIPAVLAEIFSIQTDDPIEVSSLEHDEYSSLQLTLRHTAETISEISRMYLLKQKTVGDEGETSEVLLLGVQILTRAAEQEENIREALLRAAQPELIGGSPLRILVGDQTSDNISLGIFMSCKPFYRSESPPNLLQRLVKAFKSLHNKD